MKTTESIPQPNAWKKWAMYASMLLLGLFLGRLFWGGATDPHAGHDHDYDADGNIIWTCSMHPQIREDGPGKCALCGMDLIPVSASASGEGPDAGLIRLSAAEINLAGLRTTRVAGGGGASETLLTGRIKADERRKSVITAHVSGRIETLSIDFIGRSVKRGEELARIYSPEVYTAQQELRQAYRLKDAQPALYEAARKKLALWKISDEHIDVWATADQPDISIPVFAEQTGVVTELMIRKGNYVERGEPLLEIDQLDQVWVILDAYERDLAGLKTGQALTVRADALPGRTWNATIRFIQPTVDPETRTIAVRAELSNNDGALKPDMLVRASVQVQATSAPVSIPATAVLWTGKRSIVYVKAGEDSDGTRFRMVEAELGARMGDTYHVISGIKAGDEVVTHAAFTLDSAAQLQGLESMMSERIAKPASDAVLQAGILREMEAYFSLKDALAADDDALAAKEAINLQKTWATSTLKPGAEDEHETWDNLVKELRSYTVSVASATDIETRRKAFQPLSDQIILILDRYGVTGITLYRQYCPMADNDNGAYWVSKEEAILNPYFGSSMLRCGEVRGTF